MGTQLPDDNEFILLWLDQPLGRPWEEEKTNQNQVTDLDKTIKIYPNTFKEQVTFSANINKNNTVSIDIL